ncbi:MAG: hypothetical protein AB8G96_09975 [Phycisphaerales bacterium]
MKAIVDWSALIAALLTAVTAVATPTTYQFYDPNTGGGGTVYEIDRAVYNTTYPDKPIVGVTIVRIVATGNLAFAVGPEFMTDAWFHPHRGNPDRVSPDTKSLGPAAPPKTLQRVIQEAPRYNYPQTRPSRLGARRQTPQWLHPKLVAKLHPNVTFVDIDAYTNGVFGMRVKQYTSTSSLVWMLNSECVDVVHGTATPVKLAPGSTRASPIWRPSGEPAAVYALHIDPTCPIPEWVDLLGVVNGEWRDVFPFIIDPSRQDLAYPLRRAYTIIDSEHPDHRSIPMRVRGEPDPIQTPASSLGKVILTLDLEKPVEMISASDWRPAHDLIVISDSDFWQVTPKMIRDAEPEPASEDGPPAPTVRDRPGES